MRHPIDEAFRQALADAAAEPPAELGAAILGRVRKRRQALLWRWLAGAGLLLALLAGGLWALRESDASAPTEARAHRASASPTPAEPPAAAQRKDAAAAHPAPAGAGGGQAQAQTQAAPERIAAPRAARVPGAKRAATPDRPALPEPLATASDDPPPSEALPPAEAPIAPETSTAAAPGISATAQWEAPALAPERFAVERIRAMAALGAMLPEAVPLAPTQPARPFRRSHWWAGASLAGQLGRYQWHADADNLRRALEGSGRWQGSLAVGALAGRSWASGWSLGIGVEADRQDQAFRYLDRKSEVHEETVTYLVTLNTEVFISSVDTLRSEVVHEALAEGAEHRWRVRVPLELAWHLGAGRWRMGPRTALLGERTVVRSSAGLAVEPGTGMVRSMAMPEARLEARYPMSLSGVLALDIGYCATDHARVFVSPYLGRTLRTFGAEGDALARPQRFGLRLMIQHRF